MAKKPKMFKYEVLVTKTIEYAGTFTVESETQLTEDEALELAQESASEGREPDTGWEEMDCSYDEDGEVKSGDIKEDC